MIEEECMTSIITRLQSIGMEVFSDTLEKTPVTVAKGSGLQKVGAKTQAAYTVASILAPGTRIPGAYMLFFSVVIAFSEPVSVQMVEEFSYRADEYSKKMSKGTHSEGIVCIPVLITNNAPDDAKTKVRTKSQAHYKRAVIPVIIDLVKGEFAYLENTPFVGRILFIPGLQLIESCIRIPPSQPLPQRPDQMVEVYERGLECPYCKMEYMYRVDGRQDKIECRNCRKEFPVPKR